MNLVEYNTLRKRIKAQPSLLLSLPIDQWKTGLIAAAFEIDPGLIQRLPEHMRLEKVAMVVATIKPADLRLFPKSALTEDVCLSAVAHPAILAMAPEEILTDRLIDEALAENPTGITYLADTWVTPERLEYCLTEKPELIWQVNERHRTYDKILNSMKAKGSTLYLCDKSAWTQEMVVSALVSMPLMLKDLPQTWMTESVLLDFAEQRNKMMSVEVFDLIPDSLRTEAVLSAMLPKFKNFCLWLTPEQYKHYYLTLDLGGHPNPTSLDNALKMLLSDDLSQKFACLYLKSFFEPHDFANKKLPDETVVRLSALYPSGEILKYCQSKNARRSIVESDFGI